MPCDKSSTSAIEHIDSVAKSCASTLARRSSFRPVGVPRDTRGEVHDGRGEVHGESYPEPMVGESACASALVLLFPKESVLPNITATTTTREGGGGVGSPGVL